MTRRSFKSPTRRINTGVAGAALGLYLTLAPMHLLAQATAQTGQLERDGTAGKPSGWSVKAPAAAGSSGPVTSQLTVNTVVTQADGKEVLLPAASARPGDTLQYTADYQNRSSGTVREFMATLPIPVGTEVVTSGHWPAGALASLDGLRFEAMPLKRKQRSADGSWTEVLIPLQEYRYLRWPAAELTAGGRFVAQARVTVLTQR